MGAFGALIYICFAISDSLRCVLRGLIMQNFPEAPHRTPLGAAPPDPCLAPSGRSSGRAHSALRAEWAKTEGIFRAATEGNLCFGR